MLIRCRGYNSGVKEYLENGQKSGRELSRDELDERVILTGNLELTDLVYKSIPDNGQDRYLTFTLSFKEDEIQRDVLSKITQEFKSFLMAAYDSDEFNFYAEAHLPKVKTMIDKKSGESVERKPHIHVVIPRKNLLSGNEMNPVGNYKQNEKYFEAFQEYINQKYMLESPRENVRTVPTSYADMLSRYKGDDFRAKNKDFKEKILERIFDENITTRKDFYSLVSEYGQTKIRNAGKPNEYIAVKLSGDKKFTNLKESIFSDEFILNRKVKKEPLDKNLINSRFNEWGQRAKEIKYIDKMVSQKVRDNYYSSTANEKEQLLLNITNKFYHEKRGFYGLRSERARDNKRGFTQSKTGTDAAASYSLQDLPDGYVAGSPEQDGNQMLLPGDARIHMADITADRNTGLRRPLPSGSRRGKPGASRGATESSWLRGRNSGYVGYDAHGRSRFELTDYPPFPRINNRIPAIGDVYSRSETLLGYKSLPAHPTALNQNRKSSRRRIFPTPYPILPRIRNQIPTLEDVNRRGRYFFNSGTISGENKFPIPHELISSKSNISSLPAWLIRRLGDNPSTQKDLNKLLRTVDRDFYDIKREVLSDSRFNYQEKTQLLSVMNFERLKRKDAIRNKQEGYFMGSKEIRDMLDKRLESNSGFTISAPDSEPEQTAQSRFKRVVERLRNPVNYSKVADESRKSVEKHLEASNLYTKRTRKGHVHYLDKATDKTLFVDNGKLITMRKNGLSKDSVAIAIELAQGRFGSTLNIKGSKQFKEMVVNVVAERGLDIHFTDKKMNEALRLRKAELEKGKEESGQQRGSAFTIEGAEHEMTRATAEQAPNAEPKTVDPSENTSSKQTGDEPLYRPVSQLQGKIVKHGAAPYLNKEGNSPSYFVTLKDKDGQESTQWGVGLKDALKGLRRGNEIKLELKESKPVEVRVRDEHGVYSTQEATRHVWEATKLNNPQPSKSTKQKTHSEPRQTKPESEEVLDYLSEQVVAAMETKASPEPIQVDTAKPIPDADKSTIRLEGKIVKHGAAPYLNEEGNRESYYVTLQDKNGQESTHWGVGLKDALHGFRRGYEVSLEHKGSETVQVPSRDENGVTTTISAQRNIWEATRLDGKQPEKPKEPAQGDITKGFRMVNFDEPGLN